MRVSERVPVRGDRWLLCSDGVSDYLPDDAIGALVASASEPAVAARALVAAALRAVSRDKVTAVIADVVDGVNIRVSEHRGYWG